MKVYFLKLRLLPTILFTAFVILIVKAHSYSLDFVNMPNLPIDSSTTLWDVFSYGKSSAIFVITVYAAVTMAYLLLIGQLKIKKTKIYIPMCIYGIGVVISYIMSDYKWLAFYGSVERFEGTRTILCYLFMLFYTINVVDELKDTLTVIGFTLIGVFVACLIGITQLLGHDIFLTDLMKLYLTGSNELSVNGIFGPGQVYQTVANMNYVGMYLVLVIPVVIYAIYFLTLKKNRVLLTNKGIYNKKRQILISALIVLLLMIGLNIFGTKSFGGLLGICFSLGIFLYEILDKTWQKVSLIVILLMVFVGGLSYVYVKGVDDHNYTGHKYIDFIETEADRVNMSVDGNVISIIYHKEYDNYELRDGDNKAIYTTDYPGEDGMYRPDDRRFGEKIRITPVKDINGQACVIVDVMDNEWETFGFTYYEDGVKYMNPFGNEVSLGKIESVGFKGHLSAGSGRAYIWSRTIPLLRNSILTGYGADTFLVVFPQNDYAGKYCSGTPLSTVIDKPHNIFLNMAVGTGLLSMIAFLVMVAMTLWNVFHLGKEKLLIKVMAAGIAGFLVAGLFNDSTVSIMPIFYGLLGTVISESITERGLL